MPLDFALPNLEVLRFGSDGAHTSYRNVRKKLSLPFNIAPPIVVLDPYVNEDQRLPLAALRYMETLVLIERVVDSWYPRFEGILAKVPRGTRSLLIVVLPEVRRGSYWGKYNLPLRYVTELFRVVWQLAQGHYPPGLATVAVTTPEWVLPPSLIEHVEGEIRNDLAHTNAGGVAAWTQDHSAAPAARSPIQLKLLPMMSFLADKRYQHVLTSEEVRDYFQTSEEQDAPLCFELLEEMLDSRDSGRMDEDYWSHLSSVSKM